MVNLVKLEGNKRRLVEFLLENGEQPLYKITEHFKKTPEKEGGGITQQAVSKMTSLLNPSGLVSFRTNEEGDKMVLLNQKRLITKYASNRFLPHTISTALAYPISLGIALLIAQIWFFLGAASIITCVFVCLTYFILKTNKMKDYYYERQSTQI